MTLEKQFRVLEKRLSTECADTVRGLIPCKISYQPWVIKSASLSTEILISFCGKSPLYIWYLGPPDFGNWSQDGKMLQPPDLAALLFSLIHMVTTFIWSFTPMDLPQLSEHGLLSLFLYLLENMMTVCLVRSQRQSGSKCVTNWTHLLLGARQLSPKN